MAMEHIDPPERPPEVVSELAGAELALPYLLESPDVAAFTRMAAGGVARARVAEPMLPLLAATLWSSREGLIPRGLAIVVCYLVFISLVAGFLFLLVPRLSRDVARLGKEAPGLLVRINEEWTPEAAHWLEGQFPSLTKPKTVVVDPRW